VTRTTFRAAAAALVLVAGTAPAEDVFLRPADPPARPHGVRLEGGWVEAGAVNLVKGDVGFLAGAHLALGTVLAPWIDLSSGVRYWTADIDRTEFGDTASGSVRNVSIHPDLRIYMFRWKWSRPYVLGGLAGQFVSADVADDTSLEDALSGFRMGLDLGFGVSSTGGKIRWRVEGRRELVEDVGNWSLALGFGWWRDQHAERRAPLPSRDASAASPPTPVRAAVPAVPAVPPEEPPARDDRDAIEPLVRDLVEQNQAMRAEMDSLRRALEEQRARPAPPAPPALPPPPAPPVPGLGVSLERMAALSTMTHLAPTDEGWRLVLGGELAFESGEAALTAPGREEIRRLADVLVRHPKARVVVEGHSDSYGNAMENLTLSEQRASAVRNELILSGVEPGSIRARGLGSGLPIADNSTPEGRARNRRVEIRVIDPAGGGEAR